MFGQVLYECIICSETHDTIDDWVKHFVNVHPADSNRSSECLKEHYLLASNCCRKCAKEISPLVNHVQCRGVPPNGCEWCKQIFLNLSLRLQHEVRCQHRKR